MQFHCENRLILRVQDADRVWMVDLPVAAVDGTGSTTKVGYIHADGLGTPRAVADANGVTIWAWTFQGNPFGEVLPTSPAGYMLNLRFPGQYYDGESSAVYNIHRLLDSSTGRYLQSDPLGISAGTSTYAYVGGDPLRRIDPLGLVDDSYRPEPVIETPEMAAAYKRLQALATTAANNVDATCGLRCVLPWIRGTLIHSEFKRLVDTTCPASQYRSEVSYKSRNLVPYGTPGSSRADVVFGPVQRPIAAYDLKTGWAYITTGQANAYGENLPAGTPISVIRPDGR